MYVSVALMSQCMIYSMREHVMQKSADFQCCVAVSVFISLQGWPASFLQYPHAGVSGAKHRFSSAVT